jgi:hypothetical protein
MPTTVIPPSPPSRPRLSLAPTRGRTVLDGGWWPRSWTRWLNSRPRPRPVERYGRIRHIMLNIHTWDGRFRRLAVGPDVVGSAGSTLSTPPC